MLAEGHFVGPQDPADHDGRVGVEGHEGAVDGPFPFDDAGVKDDEAGDGLKAYEAACCELPGVVAGVEPGGVGHGALGDEGGDIGGRGGVFRGGSNCVGFLGR